MPSPVGWSIAMTWLLLIYTVPSKPSRARAAVWRALKQAGAVYLRDGVAVLPERTETRATFQAIAAHIEDLEGQAALVEGARLSIARGDAVVEQARASRTEEYAEIGREAELLLAHVKREQGHRELTFAEREVIEEDLAKLRRWLEQVRARDHFATATALAVDDLLNCCDEILEEDYPRSEEVSP